MLELDYSQVLNIFTLDQVSDGIILTTYLFIRELKIPAFHA